MTRVLQLPREVIAIAYPYEPYSEPNLGHLPSGTKLRITLRMGALDLFEIDDKWIWATRGTAGKGNSYLYRNNFSPNLRSEIAFSIYSPPTSAPPSTDQTEFHGFRRL